MPDHNAFSCDVAIFAVASDAALVAELMAALSPRLQTPPVWAGHPAHESPGTATLLPHRSRLALVLHQRLWRHDDAMQAETNALRLRIREQPESVCVMRLDETPIPSWLADAPTCDLRASGLAGVADFAANAIVSTGGAVRAHHRAASDDSTPDVAPRWVDAPTPFLGQLRAHSALRHELDAMGIALKSELTRRHDADPDSAFELHTLPHRLVARFADRGVSFSWIGASSPSVAEGRLLVIEWQDVSEQLRGVAALKSATPVREQLYRPEGTNAETWHWRMDVPNGRAFSTANLVAQAVSGLALAASA